MMDGRLAFEPEPVARPMRWFQQDAIDRLRASLASGHRRPILQLPTGAGKTKTAAEIVNSALRKGKRVVFTVPALSLIDQTLEAFWHDGVRDMGVIQAQHVATDWSKPVQVASVQTLARRGYPECDLVIVDECHVVFDVIRRWVADPCFAKVPFIGLSATPWSKGLGLLYDDLISSVTTQQLIDEKFLSPFRVFGPSSPDLQGVRTVRGDFHEGDLSKAVDKTHMVADVVETWIRCGENRPTLCFGVDCAHAKHLHARFEAAGVKAAYIDADTDMGERKRIGDQLRKGAIEVICNIATLIVGIDWDIRCIIMARPTKSEMLFCLDDQTEILTSHGWMGRGKIKAGDVVPTLADLGTGRGCWSRVTDVIDRDMSPDEQWVEYSAPRANFRVTGNHRMIYSSGGSYSPGKFAVGTASEMAACRGNVYMPTAVEIDQPGVPLTDAELYFIGMMMTDGTWTATSGSISQSERHPEIIERIEDCLKSCGIAYSKRRVSAPKPGEMKERHARWQYSIAAGDPKPGQPRRKGPIETRNPYQRVDGIRGYRYLLPFMDKNISPALMSLSRTQFEVLLSGIFDGDGFKMKSPSIDWTPRSCTVCSSRPVFIDRLQALAAINGSTGHLRKEIGSRKNPIFILTVTPKAWRSVGGYATEGKTRPQITVAAATNERVWCIETEAGTIITRRRGKVTVMGNCQILGRGLRVAEGKRDLLILDHSDNHTRLGFITDIGHSLLHNGAKESDRERRSPLPKKCAKCAFLRPPRVSQCPNCGFKPELTSSVKNAEGELAEITRGQKKLRRAGFIELRGRDIPLQDFYAELLSYATAHSYSVGWANHKYREAIGVWPNAHRGVPPRPVSMEVASWAKSRMIAWAKSKRKDEARP